MQKKPLRFTCIYILPDTGNLHGPWNMLWKHKISPFPFVAFDCSYSDSVAKMPLVANDRSTQSMLSHKRDFYWFMKPGRQDRVWQELLADRVRKLLQICVKSSFSCRHKGKSNCQGNLTFCWIMQLPAHWWSLCMTFILCILYSPPHMPPLPHQN